eukprot:TRINITY_DN3654_c0_g1_i2.p1 TRINITY_DN3654_c0_g1~~TRINITY_DN3654_c0_g1_i2.p1  ORF type:complete len:212 (-),score=32.14 TRINITY_DN3654_c0_g1_i2:391-978(-)
MDVELYGEDAAATTGTGNDSATNTDTTTTTTTPTYKGDPIHFTLSCNKKTYPIDFGSDETVTAFQLHAATLTGVPVALQKLVFKGPVRDASKTLRETGIGQGSKLMLFGSTLTQVMEVNQKPDQSQLKDDEPKKEALCDQTVYIHTKLTHTYTTRMQHTNTLGTTYNSSRLSWYKYRNIKRSWRRDCQTTLVLAY